MVGKDETLAGDHVLTSNGRIVKYHEGTPEYEALAADTKALVDFVNGLQMSFEVNDALMVHVVGRIDAEYAFELITGHAFEEGLTEEHLRSAIEAPSQAPRYGRRVALEHAKGESTRYMLAYGDSLSETACELAMTFLLTPFLPLALAFVMKYC